MGSKEDGLTTASLWDFLVKGGFLSTYDIYHIPTEKTGDFIGDINALLKNELKALCDLNF